MPMRRGIQLLTVLAALVAAAGPSVAQSGGDREAPLRLQRLGAAAVVLDGRPDDAAWQGVRPLPLTMYLPTWRGDLTEETVVRVAYDDQYLYVAAELYDRDPAGIQAFSLARDADNGGDFFNVVLDPFNDDENGLAFSTTPAGNRVDAQVTNDGEGPTAANYFWDAHWDVAVSRDARGWYVEMRIPFSSLRFEARDGVVTMGLIVNRLIGRKNERQTFPAIPPRWAMGPFKPSRAQDVVFEGITPRRQLLVSPYATSRHRSRAAQAVPGAPFTRTSVLDGDVGGDLRYALTSDLTLDVSVNTDFAETRADLARVNLTRFSLFFPEQRPFFLERQGVFEFGLTGLDRPFYSRRIGLTEQGEPVDLLGGARLTGRVGAWDIGVLTMQALAGEATPRANLGAVRIRRPFGRGPSYLGGILTTRVAGDGVYNVLAGGDAEVALGDELFVTADAARTFDDTGSDAGGTLASWAIRTRIARRSTEGAAFRLDGAVVGRDYRPALGFARRTGVVQVNGAVQYGFLRAGSQVRLVTPQLNASVTAGSSTGAVETVEAAAAVLLEAVSGAVLGLRVEATGDELADGFALPDGAAVPPGSYEFVRAGATLTPAQGWKAGLGADVSWGGFYHGTLLSISVTPLWNLSSHLRLTGAWAYDRARFAAQGAGFTTHLGRLAASGALNARLSLDLLGQVTTAEDLVTGQIRIRYAFREGTDLWIVYGHVLDTAREGMPRPPLTRTTALSVKYTYTFVR